MLSRSDLGRLEAPSAFQLTSLSVGPYACRVSSARFEISRFLREQGVTRTTPLLVAVSGGADSMALLGVVVALGQRSAAAHVNHGLRGAQSDADEALVARRAGELGVPFHSARVDATRADGRSPEARARALRYEALELIRAREGYAHIATAHTLDDQAETVLLRSIRGTGLEGLAGIEPRSEDGRLLRPALGLEREVLRGELIGVLGEAWREDPGNRDPSVPRSRLRSQVLPALEEIHPGARHRLAGLAQRAREARRVTRAEAGRLLDGAIRDGAGGWWLDAEPLLRSPLDLRLRALADLLRRAGLAERVTADHLQRASDFLASAATGKALSLPGNCALHRTRRGFWLGPADARPE